MQKAVNPQTGEVLFLVDNQWVKPTQTAVNPQTGENAYLVNNAWQVMPMPKPIAASESIISPEEQMMGSAVQPSQGYGVVDATKDVGKLVGAGAVTGSFGAPEAIESGAQETAKQTMFGPSTAMEYLADPRKLANKMAGAFNLAPIFEESKNIIPPKFDEKQRLAVDEALVKGKIPQFRKLTDIGETVSKDIRDSVSDEMKLAMAESQPTGNILKAFQTGDFSDISMGANPSFKGLAGHAANVFGTALPAFATALVTKNVGPAAAMGFGQAGSEAVNEAREYINKMSDEELSKKSPYFANLLVLGYDPKTARQMTEAKAGDTAAMYQGAVGALGSAFTSKLINGAFDKSLLASAKSRLGKIASGVAVGASEGALTEFAEGVASDLGIDKTVVREIGVDSFANLVLGALGEGAPGVVAGVRAPTETQELTPEEAVQTPSVQAAAVAPVEPPVPGEVAPSPAIIQEGEIEAVPEEEVTPVTLTKEPTFDQWRTEKGITFGSKEEYEAALPRLKAEYEAEISNVPAEKTEEPKPLTGMDKRLDDLVKNKDVIIQQMADNYNISPEYAAKAYDAELEYTEAASRAYENHPNKISEKDFTAAIKKHSNFFNKLKGVSKRQKPKEVVQEPVQVEEPAAKEGDLVVPIIAYGGDDTGMTDKVKPETLWVDGDGKAFVKGTNWNHSIDNLRKNLPESQAKTELMAAADKLESDFKANKVEPTKAAKPTKEEKIAANKARQAEKKAKAEKPSKLSDALTGKDLVDMFVPEQYKKAAQEYVDANNAYTKAWSDMEKIKDKAERQQFMNEITGARGLEVDAIGRKLPPELLSLLYKGMGTKSLNEQQDIIAAYEKESAPKKPEKKTAKKEAKVTSEKKEEAAPTKEAKPDTEDNIESAVAKAGEKVDYDKMKKSAENQVDQAIKRTKYMTEEAYKDAKIPDAERFVTIKLQGDGSFKVKNNKERLEEFKKKLVNAIKPKQAGTPRREWESAAVGFKAESAFKNFLNEQEPETAVAIANLTKLDIKKVKLNPTQQKILNDYIKAAKEAGNEPMMETIRSKPGVNAQRMAKMLGQQLYGNMDNITQVSVKEMVQNSFDAIKTLIENKTADSGDIDIKVDAKKRTIEITDNGSGMTADVLGNTFLTIAGTKKETEFGSGGFGIAKMQFLYGNKDLEVITMRDGKISQMKATGEQLLASLEDPELAPNIEVTTPEESPELAKMFPDDSGTYVKVTVPSEYKDQSTGEMKPIKFNDSVYDYDSLRKSPLFAPIEVRFNGSRVYDMGVNFDPNDYTTFVDAKFDWGTARIYASKEQMDKYGSNGHILSNGLWQFSEDIKINPSDMFGDTIPYRFYIDIVSKVKPDEDGYPFELNRQGFTKEARSDLNLIKNYLTLHYRQKDFNNTVTNFGTVQYLSKPGDVVVKSDTVKLIPEIPEIEKKEGLQEGSKVEVKDGKLIVNGKEVPILTPEDLKKASIDIDSLRVPQDSINPNQVMIHDNLEVSTNNVKAKLKDNEKLLFDNYEDRVRIREKLMVAESEGSNQIESLQDELSKLQEEQKILIEKKEELGKLSTDATYTPITELAREKFGDRFDSFMFDIGDTFATLRDGVAKLMPKDKRGVDYSELAKEAIGISFDKEYRGVSIVLPFKGLFLNPAFPEYLDTPEEAALGMFGTMIHELAHHKVRSHNADFPAEMQRILIKLESSPDFDIQKVKNDFILTVRKNKDIIDFLNKEGSNEDNRAIGQRFKDSAYQKRGKDTAADLSKRGEQGRGEPRVSGTAESGIEDIREERELEPVPSEGKGSSSDIEEVQNLLKKHARPNTPLHPTSEVADAFMGSVQKGKKIYARVKENPMMVAPAMVSKLDRATTHARNKNIWYGTGLEQADFAKYNGQLRTGQQDAIASVAVTNAIHAGHVGTQVLIQGKLEYNDATQMFQASKSDKSMANVIKLKSKLMKKLGDQEATDLINGYFEAKRSRSIINEYLNREAAYEMAVEQGEDEATAAKNLKNIEVARQKVNMDDEQIDDFIAMDKKFPELRQMMDNWTAVNHNMLDNMVFSGVISKRRAADLKKIEDYVPWYRIMDEQADIHQPTGGVVRGLTNVAQDKKFKKGEVNRDIDDIVDNMIHNVMMMTRNSMRNYAANRVVAEYGTRKENGKLKVFASEGVDADGVRFNIIANGRRIIVQIKDPLIAESVIGMENIEIPMNKILATMANGLRRTITFSGVFQVKQLFMDAPTAAWVSGLKNPFAVWGGTFSSFLQSLRKEDPIVQLLKSYGIGGFQSTARTPEKELKLEIGLLNHSNFAKAIKFLDHIGDSSDYAQRRSIYKRVMKETSKTGKWQDGDQLQALIQANNVIDFLKHGSGQTAQFLTRTVSFMNAYAQQIDVLAQTLAGGGLKGKDRAEGIKRMAITGGLLASTTLLYCMVVGADDDYQELDDQTKIRNLYIPYSKKVLGHAVILPMHTSASFFFKSIPELIYNKVMNQGTKNEMDNTRLRTALKDAAIDSLLGPNAVPTGAKPFVEIGLNRNFFTGGQVTPKGMESLEAAEQYTSATSELGKVISALTSVPGTEKRALNPVEADHLMRSLFGSVAAMSMWGSNMLAGDRPESRVKDLPVIGQFVLPEVPRGNESLFYDFKERSDEKYNTYTKLMERNKIDEADKYLDKNMGLIAAHDYVTAMESGLKEINKQIRTIGEIKDPDLSKSERRKEITGLQEIKKDILDGVGEMRKESGL